MSDRDSGVDSDSESTMLDPNVAMPEVVDMARAEDPPPPRQQAPEQQPTPPESFNVDIEDNGVQNNDDDDAEEWNSDPMFRRLDLTNTTTIKVNLSTATVSGFTTITPSTSSSSGAGPLKLRTAKLNFDFSSITLMPDLRITDFMKQLYGLPSTSAGSTSSPLFLSSVTTTKKLPNMCYAGDTSSALSLVPYSSTQDSQGLSQSPMNKLVSKFENLGLKPKARKHFKPSPYELTADHHRLRQAVLNRDIARLRRLICSGVSINRADSHRRTLLHLASAQGSEDIVALLLDHGANPNLKDSLGNTPLHLAVCASKIAVVTLLLKHHANCDEPDMHGRTPISLAKSKLAIYSSELRSHRMISQALLANLVAIVEMLVEYFRQTKSTALTNTHLKASTSSPSTSSPSPLSLLSTSKDTANSHNAQVASQWLGQLDTFKAKVAGNQSGAEVIEQDVNDLLKALETLNLSSK